MTRLSLVLLCAAVLNLVIGVVDLECVRRGKSPIFHNRLVEALVPQLNAQRMARFAIMTGAFALILVAMLAVGRYVF
jgi:hypothetical protein